MLYHCATIAAREPLALVLPINSQPLAQNNADLIPDSDKSVMYIKDRMRVRDASGKEFDIEMDLKVEIQPARSSEVEHRKLELSQFSNRFMCPISIPWRHAFSRKQVESGDHRTRSSDDVFKVPTCLF